MKLVITPTIEIKDPDLSECRGCEETIYSKVTVVTFVTGRGRVIGDGFKFCESCADLLDFMII